RHVRHGYQRPPRPPPPYPPPPRSSRGLASFTVSARPSMVRPLSFAIAAFASDASGISTEPKPLLWPQYRSSTTLASVTVPSAATCSRSGLLATREESPPT